MSLHIIPTFSFSYISRLKGSGVTTEITVWFEPFRRTTQDLMFAGDHRWLYPQVPDDFGLNPPSQLFILYD